MDENQRQPSSTLKQTKDHLCNIGARLGWPGNTAPELILTTADQDSACCLTLPADPLSLPSSTTNHADHASETGERVKLSLVLTLQHVIGCDC